MLRVLVISSWLIVFGLYFSLVPSVHACHEPTHPADTTTGACPAGLDQIENLISHVISISVGLAFVALFVVLLWAGIKFLTSGGDPKALQSAQQTVVWALLGILFLAIAWLVLRLVAAFTGIPELRIFDIGQLCTVADLNICVPRSLPTGP